MGLHVKFLEDGRFTHGNEKGHIQWGEKGDQLLFLQFHVRCMKDPSRPRPGKQGSSSPCPSSFPLLCKPEIITLKQVPKVYSLTWPIPPPEADYQDAAIKEMTSSHQKPPSAHLIGMRNQNMPS